MVCSVCGNDDEIELVEQLGWEDAYCPCCGNVWRVREGRPRAVETRQYDPVAWQRPLPGLHFGDDHTRPLMMFQPDYSDVDIDVDDD